MISNIITNDVKNAWKIIRLTGVTTAKLLQNKNKR